MLAYRKGRYNWDNGKYERLNERRRVIIGSYIALTVILPIIKPVNAGMQKQETERKELCNRCMREREREREKERKKRFTSAIIGQICCWHLQITQRIHCGVGSLRKR